jgi:hypothetical protein
MSYENILFDQDGPVATITINREKLRNALNGATIAEIGVALAEVERDDRLRVAIITGAGEKAFAAGADINELRALPSADAARQLATQMCMFFHKCAVERKGRFLIQVGAFLGQGSADCSYHLRVVPATQRNFSLASPTLAHPVEGPWEERDFARELGLDRLKVLRARTVVVPPEKASERMK